MILEDLGIPYKIVEAQGDVGGRLYTHHFERDIGTPFNYFDIGAMRFPKTDSMNRVFNLFDDPNLNTPDIALGSRIKRFHFVGAGNNNTLLSYNGITIRQNNQPPLTDDVFRAREVVKDTDAARYIAAGTTAIVNDVIRPYGKALLNDLKDGTQDGWELMKSVEDHSTRSYMAFQYRPSSSIDLPATTLPNDIINWCETFDKSTGWYDRSFSETVLEAIAFGWNPDPSVPPPNWFLVEGGSNKIAQAMAAYIKKQKPDAIDFNSRISYIGMGKDGSNNIMEVKVDQRTTSYKFSHVISTLPLTVLRTINIKNAGLSLMQSNALRELNYGPSVKIGMLFRTAWWTSGKDKDGNVLNIVGGQTYTDRPLRTVVYPSYGDVMAGKTSALIASYCWTDDATRLSALIGNDNKLLQEFVLTELADIHNVDLDYLRNQLVEMKPWSWSNAPYAMGAFAFFGPGKFKNLYTALTTPAGGNAFHFAGEAISVRHAWVEGALDSAWRAVAELLVCSGADIATLQKFTDNWGVNLEWVKSSALTRTAPTKSFPATGLPILVNPRDTLFSIGSSLLVHHLAAAEAATAA
ncbi:hypothetical protein B0H16DRAFT_1295633 [Mycena metata]|uniref:Amine oxidase domain-containing protein n=1 Tax=Mycena metata TaxID=1033252 RepID=A0AAD7P2R9_9AGAR|nr:hypothetical protein B0H16DRAFT_1295633 [Mycena metata]